MILLNEIANSGIHVQKAAMVNAITILGTLKLFAKLVDASTNKLAKITIKIRPNINKNTFNITLPPTFIVTNYQNNIQKDLDQTKSFNNSIFA